MIGKNFFLSLLLIGLAAVPIAAKVELPAIFSNNMVLQQNTECNLWGKAAADRILKITTSWNRKTYRTVSDRLGRWHLQIKTPVAGGPYSMTFNDGEITRIDNILIGEVWICSGQSNMEMPMKGFKGQPVEGATEELLNGPDERLRLFTVQRNAKIVSVDTVHGSWKEANAGAIRQFSAIGYFFGKTLRKNLRIPIGLIEIAWGGSRIEAWMTSDWLKAFPSITVPGTQQEVDKTQQRCPTALYNGMLHPLIGYTIRGVVWYQGEENVRWYRNYDELMAQMVCGCSKKWDQVYFTFYYCQIAPYKYHLLGWMTNSAFLREQQAQVEKDVPNCRMSVLMDAGLPYCIHARKKRQAGERLALLALSHTYSIEGLPEFACYKDVVFKQDTTVISFDRSKEWIYFNHGLTSNLFRVAGADKIFHPAKAWINRNRVYVCSDEVKHPVAVRYAFTDWAEGDLFHDGLPVSSFRTDHWDDVLDNNY